MAVLKIQENIKKADGTYDTVHKETEAGLVLFDDNKTLTTVTEELQAEVSAKVAIVQGTSNAGKVLGVLDDGNVGLVDQSGAKTWGTLTAKTWGTLTGNTWDTPTEKAWGTLAGKTWGALT